jgi:hypothetical protein
MDERGTDHQSSILKKCFSWLKVNLLRFAIKQIKHERGTGTLPRGIVDKGLYKRQKVGYATLGLGWLGPPFAAFCLIRLIAFGIDCLFRYNTIS